MISVKEGNLDLKKTGDKYFINFGDDYELVMTSREMGKFVFNLRSLLRDQLDDENLLLLLETYELDDEIYQAAIRIIDNEDHASIRVCYYKIFSVFNKDDPPHMDKNNNINAIFPVTFAKIQRMISRYIDFEYEDDNDDNE